MQYKNSHMRKPVEVGIAQTPERRVMQDCLQSYIRAEVFGVTGLWRKKHKCVGRESRPSSLGHDRDQHLVFMLRENTQTRKAGEAGPLADPLYKYQTGRSKIEM
jgi:hypothetical protein